MEHCFTNRHQNEIGRSPVHIYLAPHPLLRPYIAHYTLTHPNFDAQLPSHLTLVPDASGCLVFTLDQQLSSILYGATTRVVVVESDFNEAPVRLFVEFLPGGLSKFVGDCQDELTDRRLTVEEVCPALYSGVREAAERARDLDELVMRVDRLLLSLLPDEDTRLLAHAVALLEQRGGSLPVAELSRLLCYSERQINRLFNARVGMGVKKFSRLLRVNGAIQRMSTGEGSLTDLAQDSGFYDQPHFIRDFKEVCGTTPRQYLLNMSGFYNETLKFSDILKKTVK